MNLVGSISLLVQRNSRSNNVATDILYELDESENLAASAIDGNALVREMGILCPTLMI
jgi:hypothetical protein